MLYTKLKSTIYVRRTCLEVISFLTLSSDIFLPKLSKAYTYITYSGPLQFTHDSPYLWSNASEGMMLHVLIFWGQIKCIKFGDIFSIFFGDILDLFLGQIKCLPNGKENTCVQCVWTFKLWNFVVFDAYQLFSHNSCEHTHTWMCLHFC
jgi:hypothetical protein